MLDLQSIYFGRNHKEFDIKDMKLIQKVRRLARKHQKQCENSCNGVGYVNGQVYYCGMIDDYAKRTVGASVKSAYSSDDEASIFDKEVLKIEDKINKLVYQFNWFKYTLWKVKPFKVDFQGDPRGATVKLTYNGSYIEL